MGLNAAINHESMYLIADIDVSILGQQQRHQVHAAFLCCQVDGADALPCYCVGVSSVLQQRGPNIHLVLFGSDVQWCVTILSKAKEKKHLITKKELFQEFHPSFKLTTLSIV